MIRHVGNAGILVLLLLVSVGCGRQASHQAAESTSSGAEPTPSAAAQTPQGARGNIPDPCTLLSDAEVTQLTGREITQVDRDGADASATTRYCQWQQPSGQLAVFITRTNAGDFTTAQADSPAVPGLGDGAYSRDGHLYVLVGATQLDVYSRGGDDQQSEAEAERVATTLVPKTRTFS
jgi:hypothetical protein